MGNLRLNKVVVFDLEALCWANKEEQGAVPSEIIEIGACLLDIDNGNIYQQTRYTIRPKNLVVSEYCTNLTGHTVETLKKGIPLKDCLNKFAKEFGTKNKICAAYGDDNVYIDTECKRNNLVSPLSGSYINICHLFALKQRANKFSLVGAISKIGYSFEGTQHHADWDAVNAAKILRSCLE